MTWFIFHFIIIIIILNLTLRQNGTQQLDRRPILPRLAGRALTPFIAATRALRGL